VLAWTLVREGEGDPLAARARELSSQVALRLDRRGKSNADGEKPLQMRARRWELQVQDPSASAPNDKHKSSRSECPRSSHMSLQSSFDWLDIAPRSSRGTESACWATLLAETLQQLSAASDPLSLARAVMILRDWPAQETVAASLADRLRAAAPIRADGTMVLPSGLAEDRAARSMVMAALVQARKLGTVNPDTAAGAAKMWARLMLDRDASGGYGSAQATRLAVQALLDADAVPTSPAAVRWTELSGAGHVLAQGSVNLSAKGASTLTLSSATTRVRLETASASVIARVERPLFRSFLQPPNPASSPLHIAVAVPKASMAEGLASLQISLRHELDRQVPVFVRIPLPPGASLAEPVSHVRQVQGALYIRTTLDSDALPRVLSVPLRLALSGLVTMPEATARIDDDDVAPAHAAALPMVIAPSW
jgi:hypothetical protein